MNQSRDTSLIPAWPHSRGCAMLHATPRDWLARKRNGTGTWPRASLPRQKRSVVAIVSQPDNRTVASAPASPPGSPPSREPIKKAAWSGRRSKAQQPPAATPPACLLPPSSLSCRSGKKMRGVSLLLLVVLSAAAASPQLVGAANGANSLRIIQKDIIETINKHPNAGWTAGHNPYLANYTIEQFKHILGVKPTPPGLLAGVPTRTYSKSKVLPKEFDARSKWSGCSTIGNILDQGHCGSCWAFGAVECLQDRFCIHHNLNISLSANDLVACCGFLCGDGCDGGYPISAWQYFVQTGVVTDECDPYFDQVGCKHPGCEPAYPTPVCEKKCKVQNQVWQEKKHFSINAYRVNSDPHDIMTEVYQNGPVEVAFTVYEDFAHYKSGVYKHITGGVMGGHAVKLIGWGTSDAGDDYWLLANQWNRGWGDDGYFKIIRGKNECGIEEDVVAGMPLTKNIAGDLGSAFGTAIL